MNLWTQCEGVAHCRSLTGTGWRVVESQFVNSTRKLVDSDEEQAVLEALIDGVKPALDPEIARLGLHYLLFTPFRHPPLRNGSRFGTRMERGIFYGAKKLPTAFAEVAYYRMVFLSGTEATLGLVETPLTAFSFRVRARRAVQLVEPPFDAHRKSISSPTDYAVAQELGRGMRKDGVELATYVSARDPDGGVNWAIFSPVFPAKTPEPQAQEWQCNATREVVELKRKNPVGTRVEFHRYARETFWVGGKLPSPAV